MTTRRRTRAMTCSAALLILSACGEQPEGSVAGAWESEREQRGDTLIVRTLSGSIWGDTMSLIPEVAIGELAGAPALVFGQISGLDLDAEGRLLVVDNQSREVRIFSETGEHVLSFGGSGGGPGEFRAPDHIRSVSDGRIVVRDQGAGRFSVFSGDGKYLGGWPRASTFNTMTPFYFDVEERVVNPTFSDRLVVYELDGTPLDTITVPSLGHSPPLMTVTSPRGGSASYPIPFMPGEQWTITRDGDVLIGFAAEYSFERRDNNGRVLRIERSAERIPVANAEASQQRDQIITWIRRNNPDWQWSGPDIPSVKPAFIEIYAGIDGTIWVSREAASVEEPNPNWKASDPDAGFPTRWRHPLVADVFDEEGRYLGPVKLPESIRWYSPQPILSREWLWAAATNDDGVPQVVRFRVGSHVR